MKLLLKSLFLVLFFVKANNAISQNDLAPDQPLSMNGIEYRYTITNIQSKDDHERYEIKFFATNISNCNKYILQRHRSYNERELNLIAIFDCLNATGKRFTLKSKSLFAREWYMPFEDKSRDAGGKEIIITKSLMVGYIFRNGETISGTEIMLTPKGERPIIKVSSINIPDL